MSLDSKIGLQISKYKIVEHLGRGGMAEVYKAYHENLDRYVAIKLMHPFLASEEDFLSRFKREARAMAALNHPNIVDVFDFDAEGDVYYIVMEYISGGTLKDAQAELAESGTKMALSRAIQIVLEVADALAYAHSRGMIHRDIKPANIMLNDRNAAVLTDFGIAKILTGPSYTATGAMIGTPAYMSPEQGIGHPGDERSDLYSLGVLFYQLATGKLPYDADTPLAVVLKHVNDPIPLPVQANPELPAAVSDVIYKSLAKDPDDRYPSVHDFAKELRQAVRNSHIDLAAVPPSLLRDKPTPLPVKTAASDAAATALGPGAAATVVAHSLDPTVVGGGVDPTVVAQTPLPVATTAKKYPAWLPITGAVGVVALLLGGLAFSGILGGADITPTPLAVAVIETDTPGPTTASTVPPTIDFAATADAQAAAVEARLTERAPTRTPTSTPSLTATPSLTPSPTIDTTAEFLANCTSEITVISQGTTYNRTNAAAPVGREFRLDVVIENSGSCTVPAGLELRYIDGEELEQSSNTPFVLAESVAPASQATISLPLIAADTVGQYTGNWGFFNEDNEQFGEPIELSVRVYAPVTTTPTSPPATNTPAVAASPPAQVNVQFNTEITNCEYPGGGIEYRCQMVIVPYGGAGNTYTVWVFDSEPAARYFGEGNQVHFITARRCSPWIHEVRVQDEASGQSLSKNIFFDPTARAIFPGGSVCTVS